MDDLSSRFLDAFAAIEKHLRTLHKAAKHATFYEMIDKAATGDAAVRRVKSSLKEMADLRNFLIHGYSIAFPLAMPSEHAVGRLEAIKEQLLSPPKLVTLFRTEVQTCGPDDPVGVATGKMHKGSFSQLPVYQGRRLVGLLTAETVARWLASRLASGDGILEEETVAKVLDHQEDNRDFSLMGHDATAFDALDAFEEHYRKGRLLDAIILTPHGKAEELASGIVTVSDIPEMQRHIRA